MKNYSDITYRYLKIQKKRTLLTLLGIILSVALITSIGTMVVSTQKWMVDDAIRQYGDYHAELYNLSPSRAAKVQNHVNVARSAVMSRDGYGVVAPIGDKDRLEGEKTPPYRYLRLNSYDKAAFSMFTFRLNEGRLPQRPGELALDERMLEYFPGKPKLGDMIRLDVGDRIDGNTGKPADEKGFGPNEIFQKQGVREYTIVGLLNPGFIFNGSYFANAVAFLDSRELDQNRNYSVLVKVPSIQGVHKKVNQIAQDVQLQKVLNSEGGNTYPVNFNERVLRLSAQSMDSLLNDAMIGLLTFIIVMIVISTIAVIYNSFNISVLERVSQFGVLRCVGSTPAQIRRIVFKEAGLLSLIAIPIGLGGGIVAVRVVLAVIGTLNMGNVTLFKDMNVTLSLPVFVFSALLGFITVFASAWGPARLASRISPLEAVRNAKSFRKESFKHMKKGKLAKALFGVEGYIAYKNLRRNPKRFRVTVFSMVISIVLYISFGSFVDYIFNMGAVYSNIKVDFQLGIKEAGTGELSPDLYEHVRRFPGVEKVFKYRKAPAEVLVPEKSINPAVAEIRPDMFQTRKGGEVAFASSYLVSYGDVGTPELKERLKAGKVDPGALDQENAVVLMASNRFSRPGTNRSAVMDIVKMKVGDTIWLAVVDKKNPTGPRTYRTVKVAGILKEGIMKEQYHQTGGVCLITSEAMYEKLTGKKELRDIVVVMKNGAERKSVADYLKGIAGKDPKYQYMDVSVMLQEQTNMAIALSIFLYGFVGVVTLIGCLNIINTISTNLLLRTRELAVMKAVGMTENGIKRLVCLEGIFYGIIAAIYGGIMGTLLSRYGMYSLLFDVRAFEWTIPWNHILTAIIGAAVIALFAGFVPLRRINRGVIVEKIRMEE